MMGERGEVTTTKKGKTDEKIRIGTQGCIACHVGSFIGWLCPYVLSFFLSLDMGFFSATTGHVRLAESLFPLTESRVAKAHYYYGILLFHPSF